MGPVYAVLKPMLLMVLPAYRCDAIRQKKISQMFWTPEDNSSLEKIGYGFFSLIKTMGRKIWQGQNSHKWRPFPGIRSEASGKTDKFFEPVRKGIQMLSESSLTEVLPSVKLNKCPFLEIQTKTKLRRFHDWCSYQGK